MIALDGHPKLMDFGIAKREDASLTQTGTFLGTPCYASPEQIREGIVDNRSDIFSFGVMAFELFSGKTPFPGSSINTILYKIVNEPPAMPDPPLEGVFPEAWKQIFEKVLAKRPQDRYGSCVQFLDDLAKAIVTLDPVLKTKLEHRATGSIPLLSAAPTPISSIQTESRTLLAPPARRSPFYLVGGGLLVAVGVGVGYLLLRPTKAPTSFSSGAAPVVPKPLPPAEPKASQPVPEKVPVKPAEAGTGLLKVVGAFAVRIRLEGKDLGEISPGKTLELPEGTHHLELNSPKFFYRETRRITIVPGKSNTLALPGVVAITVYTYPGAGLVLVDGQPTHVESTAEKTISLTLGRHVFGIQGRSVQHPEDIRSDGQQVKFGGVTTQ